MQPLIALTRQTGGAWTYPPPCFLHKGPPYKHQLGWELDILYLRTYNRFPVVGDKYYVKLTATAP